ncbi:MAG: exodeoxyribonuclease VII small subunit [Planctomycetes bacterium]|nr:exodeoxyribonuclease VII small subunit [Planctomycetota bacterium]
MTKKKKPSEPTFEELLAEAEAAVEALESGELSLEESMEKYELGVRNLKQCSAFITEAQKKVEQLIADKEGQLRLTEFEEEGEE